MNPRKRPRRADPSAGHVRIIAGKWRGRKLTVAASETLRPTPDRVRETLFNWLAPYLTGASCLDLFAGTGSLGIEAVSRGAKNSVLVDFEIGTIELLKRHVEMLGADNIEVLNCDAAIWLKNSVPNPFDIIFLDPPFQRGLIEQMLDKLTRGWLHSRSWVYLESEKLPILHLQENNWEILRQGRTRHVEFALVTLRPPQ